MAHQQEATLQSVANDRLFIVPDYQRPFAWEGKQLADLWNDLDLLGTGHHYSGTLVLRHRTTKLLMTSSGVALSEWDVVDGQQRLTTCFLLLDRIRRKLASMGGSGDAEALEMAHTLRRTYGVVTIGGVARPRLTLGSQLNEFWTDTVIGELPSTASSLVAGQVRLKRAGTFFDRKIAGLVKDVPAATGRSRLLDLMTRLTTGLRFLVYEVADEAEVGVIFETVNDRGKPLSELEKLKNYLLYLARQLDAEQRDDVTAYINDKWASIFNNLSLLPMEAEDQMLRAHWLATQDPRPREWHGTSSVKALFPRSRYVPDSIRLDHDQSAGRDASGSGSPGDALYDDLKGYVRALHACSLFTKEMYDTKATYEDFRSGHSKVRVATAALMRSNTVALFRPLVFAARLTYPHDGDFYARLVDLCERYAARVFAICDRRSTAGESYLCKAAHALNDGSQTQEQLLERVRQILWSYADDTRVQQDLAAAAIWYPSWHHKYFLYEYELDLADSPADVPPFTDFVDTGRRKTTEHILPQTADKACWTRDFSEDDHDDLCHTLGNLVLTYDNSAYSNKCFATKRGNPNDTGPCYANAKLTQERELATMYPRWTPDTIRARQQHLADWAMRRWKVDPPGHARTGIVDEADDELGDQEPVEPAVSDGLIGEEA